MDTQKTSVEGVSEKEGADPPGRTSGSRKGGRDGTSINM